MSLASSIAALAARIGFEVKAKIDATHPGIARVWVSFGYVNGQVVIASARNVASVVRERASAPSVAGVRVQAGVWALDGGGVTV